MTKVVRLSSQLHLSHLKDAERVKEKEKVNEENLDDFPQKKACKKSFSINFLS